MKGARQWEGILDRAMPPSTFIGQLLEDFVLGALGLTLEARIEETRSPRNVACQWFIASLPDRDTIAPKNHDQQRIVLVTKNRSSLYDYRQILPSLLEAKMRDPAIAAEMAKARVGSAHDPAIEMGPVASRRQLETIEGYIEKGRAGGARTGRDQSGVFL